MAETRPCKYCSNPVARNAKTCPKCGGKSPFPIKTSESLGCLVLLVVLGVSCFAWLDYSGSNSTSSQSKSTSGRSSNSKRSAAAGDVTHLFADGVNNALAASTENHHDRMMTLMSAKDMDGLSLMISYGQVLRIPNGTKCRVIEPGFSLYEVRILDGQYAGRYCFVVSEFVAGIK